VGTLAPQALLALAFATIGAGCPDRSGSATRVPYVPILGPAPGPPLPPSPPPDPGPPPGACENETVDSACTFTRLSRIDPGGRPVPPDAPPEGDGTFAFSAEYRLEHGPGESAAVWVRAAPGEREALERFFTEHRQARCAGQILHSPCPPGVHIRVQVPVPPVGTVMRQP